MFFCLRAHVFFPVTAAGINRDLSWSETVRILNIARCLLTKNQLPFARGLNRGYVLKNNLQGKLKAYSHQYTTAIS